jgi:hypothetical protein
MPLADIVERMFFERNVRVYLRRPDFGLLAKVPKDVRSRLLAGEKLSGCELDLVIVHRDSDNAGTDARRAEILSALPSLRGAPSCLPIIPVRMTEAWLLLDEGAIRSVAGNPRGRADLGLPGVNGAERLADPKSLLSSALLAAAAVTGRRRERLAKRFSQNRRQLLERLDHHGPVTQLASWQRLVSDIDALVEVWGTERQR